MKKISKRLIGLTLGLVLGLGSAIAVDGSYKDAVNAKATSTDYSVTKTVDELIAENNWEKSHENTINTTLSFLNLDSNIKFSFSGTGNTGSLWANSKNNNKAEVRIYVTKNTTNASLTVSAENENVTIKTIKLTYTLDSSPTISPTITSDNNYTVQNNTETFNITGGVKNGQLRVSVFSCDYSIKSTVAPEDEAEAWGKSFMETDTALTCEDENVDNSENLVLMWSDFEDEYNNISDDAKNVVKAAVGDNNGSTYLAKAVARYDHIIARYSSAHTEINDFIGRNSSAAGLSKISKGTDNNNYLIVIFTVSFISITAVGGYFFLRKRKVN